MRRLNDVAITEMLGTLPGWSREGDELVRAFRRRNWLDAIAFIDTIAAEAERRNHHPDLCVTGYRDVTVRLTSHDAGGITERDVDLARWISEAAGGSG